MTKIIRFELSVDSFLAVAKLVDKELKKNPHNEALALAKVKLHNSYMNHFNENGKSIR